MICKKCGSELIWQNDFDLEGERRGITSFFNCPNCDNTLEMITLEDPALNVNIVYNEDCLRGLKLLPNGCIDMIITSPPYDDLRNYNGYSFDFENIARALYRVLKPGGVMVWIVGDATIKGSETGTSFKQVLFFKEIGFNLYDTMIYEKHNPVPNARRRYQQSFEFMFVLSKGKPKTVHILEEPRRNECGDKRTYRKKKFSRGKNGEFTESHDYFIKENVPRRNIWTYKVGLYNSSKDRVAFSHPAIFPERLAEDHILSWSNPGDIILDPFIGSGTTAKMALLNDRFYIGYEVSSEYCEIAIERLRGI